MKMIGYEAISIEVQVGTYVVGQLFKKILVIILVIKNVFAVVPTIVDVVIVAWF
jgi:hypothetical protein